MKWLKSPISGAFLGLMVGVFLAGVLVVLDIPESGRDSTFFGKVLKSNKNTMASSNASERFVDAWKSKLEGEYEVVATFERATVERKVITQESATAQYGDDSVRVGGGDVTRTFDGKRLACAVVDQGTQSRCRGPFDVDVTDETNREMANVESLVIGPSAHYLVSRRPDGCFELRARQVPGGPATELSALQWGNSAVFCFDEASGAVISSRVHRDSATDSVTAKTLTPTASRESLEALFSKYAGASAQSQL